MAHLHSTFIPYKTKGLVQKARKIRNSMNYQEASHVGILFSMSSLEDFETIRKFENKLRKEGKKVSALPFLGKDMENFDFHYDFFTQKDFSFFGNIQTDNVRKFLQQPFDLLICLDWKPNMYLEYLLAASAAHFRIGPYICERESLFELMISLPEGSELSELINQIYHYTNKL